MKSVRRKRGRKGGGDTSNGTGGFPGVSFSTLDTGMANRSMPLFGQRTRRNLNYVQNQTSITSGAGVAGAYVFSANGCFDPDVTGTGGQPMGFDQMMIFYNHYTVVRSSIQVIFANVTGTIPASVGIAVSGSATPLTSIEQICETGKVSWRWLQKSGVDGSIGGIRAAVDMGKYQGLVNVIDDPQMRATMPPNRQNKFTSFCTFGIPWTILPALSTSL